LIVYIIFVHIQSLQPTGKESHNAAKGRRRVAPNQPFKKELFLQANFRFLVLPSAAKQAYHATNADCNVDWEDVVHVEMLLDDPEHFKCPICLDSPAGEIK
jgi:hypothetical protein